MATTGGTNNQTKFFGSGSISLGSIKDFFVGNTNHIKFSKYYRKTSVDIPTSQFGSNAYEHYVPDATENDTVKTGGNNHAFSDFRGNGDVINGYPPIPNRMILFDASLLHRATCFRSTHRFTIAIKYELLDK